MGQIPLRQAKPSAADLEMLKALWGGLTDIQSGYFPERLSFEVDEELLLENDEEAAKAMRKIMAVLERGSLDRCVWTLAMLMDPANAVIDPDADHVAIHPRFEEMANQLDKYEGIVRRLAAAARSDQIRDLQDETERLLADSAKGGG